MVKRIAIACLLLLAVSTQAAQTVVKLDTFSPPSPSNVLAYSSTNVGQFSAVTGTLPVVAIGATTNSQPDQGWSAEMRKANAYGTFSGLSAAWYVVGGWFRFNQFQVTAADSTSAANFNNAAKLIGLVSSGHGVRGDVRVDSAGGLYLWGATIGNTNFATLTLNKWTWIGVAVKIYNPGTWRQDLALYTQPIGGTLTKVGEIASDTTYSQITSVTVGGPTLSSDRLWSGRISGVSLSTIASLGDVSVPINAPTTDRTTWFINATTGSDLNSGLYGYPWQTAEKLVPELQYGGIMGAVDPWVMVSGGAAITNTISDSDFISAVTNGVVRANGDMVLIDSAGGPLQSAYTIQLRTFNQGVEIGSTNGVATIDTLKTLSAPYTQYDSINYPNIWTVTDSDAKATMFEDKKWMDSLLGANIAVVQTTMNATAGTFWTDGTTLYFHPFGSTDPNSDGKVYQRSQKLTRDGTANYNPSSHLSGSNVLVRDLRIYHGPYRNQSSGAVDATYTMQNVSSGRTVVSGVDLLFGGNHCYGATDGDATLKRWLINSVCQQCPPWTTNATGYTMAVEYTGSSSAGNRCAYYIGVDFSIESVIGSSIGTSSTGSWLCHNNSANAGQYDVIQLSRCKGLVAMGEGIAKSGGLLVDQCNLTKLNTGSMPNVIVSRTLINGPIFGDAGATVSNCIINRNDDISQNLRIKGTWTFTGCTFDARNLAVSQIFNSVLKTDLTTAMTLNASNCIILLTQDANSISFFTYKNTDTVNMDRNVFLPSASGVVMRDNTGGSNKTLAQWQAASSQDANSLATNPCLSSSYRPYAKTPCWNVGAELGPAIDFSGKLYQSRRTAGAYEYDPPTASFLIAQ